jgi:outer membrane protein OmpA-like peptidoglycan-associated protein
LLLSAVAVHGQIRVSNVEINRDGDTATISFDARIDAKATKRDYKLILTPEVFSAGSSAALDPIVVETRRTRIRDRRDGLIPVPDARTTENGATLGYTATAPWADWMKGSDLRFNMRSEGCCSENDLGQMTAARGIGGQPAPVRTEANVNVGNLVLVMTRNSEPQHATTATAAATASMQTVVDSLNVNFAQGSSRINLNSFDNYRALNDVVSILKSRQEIALQGLIKITGTASPEGPEALNYDLARRRALAVRNYILDRVHWLRPANFEIVNGGQNWDGLYKLVEESNMPGAWEVLDIIDNTAPDIDYFSNTSRKKFLMNLNQGRTWRYMEARFFPQLRGAASITVYTPLTGGSTAAVATTPPDPNADIINRAIDLASARDYTGALALLTPVFGDARAWNPIGVCAVMMGDMDRAKEYFKLAAEAGYTDARANLEQIK